MSVRNEQAYMTTIDDVSREHVEALLVQHRQELFAYILAVLGHPQNAEDTLQECSVIILRRWQQYRRDTSFLAWAREIARRTMLKAFDHRGELTRDRMIRFMKRLGDSQNKSHRDFSAIHKEVLDECMNELGGHARSLLIQRYQKKSSVEKISIQLKKTVSATYAILKRIRMSLRTCVDRKLQFEKGDL